MNKTYLLKRIFSDDFDRVLQSIEEESQLENSTFPGGDEHEIIEALNKKFLRKKRNKRNKKS